MDTRPQAPSRRSVVEAVVASTIGTTIEWYDFFLYGLGATLVFPRLFFPAQGPFVGQLLALGTFTVGFIARPLGGALFGYMGDRIGRKSTLVTTLLLMGVSTFLMGVLPTYEQIGVAAPILLTLLRFLQGLGVGGEWGGAVLLAVEYGHRGRRGFFGSWPQAGVPLGLLMAAGVVSLFMGGLGDEAFDAWGWRGPFLLSGLLIAVGLLIRVRILETPLFQGLLQTKQVARAPLREVIAGHWREVLLAAGARVGEQSCFYLLTTYVLAYNKRVLQMDDELLLRSIRLAMGIEFFTIPLFGFLSDHITRRRTFVLGYLVMIAFAAPYLLLLHTREPVLVVLAVVLPLVTGHAMLYSVQASLIPELFGTRVRYTGASLGYQLAAPFAGLALPIVAALVEAAGGRGWPVAAYVVGISVLSLLCVWGLAETSRRELR
jgi:metabolite-proton symporter